MRSIKRLFKIRSRKNNSDQKLSGVVLTENNSQAKVEEFQNNEIKKSVINAASVAGAVTLAAALLPKEAKALVMGGTPESSIVNVKDVDNNIISPAIEATSLNIKTAVEATKAATDTINTNVSTLVTNSDKFTFASNELNITNAGITDMLGVVDRQNTRVNLVTEDSIVLLRRMVKLMESQATVDSYNRQRVSWDAFGENITGTMDTGTASASQVLMQFIDTSKHANWLTNQWSYYAVKITGGTGVGQTRLILNNTSTALTLDSPWTTLPDATSTYGIYDIAFNNLDFGTATGTQNLTSMTDTGKVWTDNTWANYAVRIVDSNGATQIRLISGNTVSALTYLIPPTYTVGLTNNIDTGTAIGDQTAMDFADTSKTWTENVWAGLRVVITSGTGTGQAQLIASNTANILTLQNAWSVVPDASSTYAIRSLPADGLESGLGTGQEDNLVLIDTNKVWAENFWANFLVVITSGEGAGQVRQIVSNTSTTLTLVSGWDIRPNTTSTYMIYPMGPQSYYICLMPNTNTDLGTSSVNLPRVALGNDANVVGTIGLYAVQQRFGDVAHQVYNDAIRANLIFS